MPGPVALDTSLFIYYIEEHPEYMVHILPLFEAIAGGAIKAATSALTLLETLVVPLRKGDRVLTDQYEAILTNSANLVLVQPSVPILRRAAELRAATAIRTPDAIHLATAIEVNCRAFVTNDHRIRPVDSIEIIQLSKSC